MNENEIHYSTHCYTCGTELEDGKYCNKCGYYVGDEHYRIQIDTNRWGAENLERILLVLQMLGSLGCSRKVEAEEYNHWKGKRLFWDGDGPDKIYEIKIYPMPMPVKKKSESFTNEVEERDVTRDSKKR